MREILVFLKYGMMISRSNEKRKLFSTLIGISAGFAGIFIFLLIALYKPFETMNTLEIGDINFARVYSLFMTTVSGFFFLTSFSVNAAYQFMRNDETELLLSFPVKRWALSLYQVLTVAIFQFMFFATFLAPSFVYFITSKRNLLLPGTVGTLITSLNICLIASIIAVRLGKYMSRGFARKIVFVSQLTGGVLFLFVIQMMPSDSESIITFFSSIEKASKFFGSPYNIFSWGILGSSDPIYIILNLSFIPILSFLFFLSSKNMRFESSVENEKKGLALKIPKVKSPFLSMVKKELLVYARYEQLVYYFLYPAIFGIIMGFATKNIYNTIFMLALSSSLYLTIQSAFLMGRESPFWETTKTFPFHSKKIIQIVIFLPVIITGFVSVITILFMNIFYPINTTTILIFLLAIFIMYFKSSVGGVLSVIKSPVMKLDNPNAFFKSVEVMKNWIFITIISIIIIFPLMLQSFANPLIQKFLNTFGIPLSFSAILFCLLMAFINLRSVNKRLKKWE